MARAERTVLAVTDTIVQSSWRPRLFMTAAMKNAHQDAPTQFITADGIRYAYRRLGPVSGVPLLLLPHFRGGLDHWDPVVTNGLALERPVILFNNAGVASSTGEPASTVLGMASHVVSFLRALQIQQVDVLGFSTGGFVAQQLAIDHPDLVRALVLAGTGPAGGEGLSQYSPLVTAHATRDVPILEDILYLFFAPSETSQAAGKAFWARRHERLEQDTPSSPAAMAAQAQAIGAWGEVPATERYASLKQIGQPALVVNGHSDVMVPTINSYILQQHIPNATLLLYPDSGHGAIFQYPTSFVAQTQLFLNALPNTIVQ
jgi:pimeloyl-ACP methyl ester carboxylesterase